MTTVMKGISSEYEVVADLIRQGYTPCKPALPNTPYDLLAEKDNDVIKVQVKSGVFKGNKMTVYFRKSNGVSRRYSREEVDFIAVHDRRRRKTAYIPFDDVTKFNLYREKPTDMHGINHGIRLRVFDDYLEISDEASA